MNHPYPIKLYHSFIKHRYLLVYLKLNSLGIECILILSSKVTKSRTKQALTNYGVKPVLYSLISFKNTEPSL